MHRHGRFDYIIAVVVLTAARVRHREYSQIVRVLRDVTAAAPFCP